MFPPEFLGGSLAPARGKNLEKIGVHLEGYANFLRLTDPL
jgi:hypothetical protein